MNKHDIIRLIVNSNIIMEWHWFQFHFKTIVYRQTHPFAASLIDTFAKISEISEEASLDLIKKLSSISGKEDDIDHYDQLMQVLAEVLIVFHTLEYKWDELNFSYEPRIEGFPKNPEFNVTTTNFEFGMEVKSPSIRPYQLIRQNPGYQLVSRTELKDLIKGENITLPRDNPVKDFLISANGKFEGFKKENPEYIGILYIIWDDFINEPISALLSEASGLFTKNSFAKDDQGKAIEFPYVDAVFISRHRVQFQQIAGDGYLPDPVEHVMDYGKPSEFPFKVVIKNPISAIEVPKEILDCFQVLELDPRMGAEYNSTDIVFWI